MERFSSRVQPLLVFSARTVTERTALGTRQSVEADQNVNGMERIIGMILIISSLFSHGSCICSCGWFSIGYDIR